MKTLILTLALILGSFFGYNSVNAADLNSQKTENVTAAQTNAGGYIYIQVYENGAIWVYVYTQDGIFVTKYEDQ